MDKGIIFSAAMVQALLDGRKTQTRRLLKGMPAAPSPDSLVHPPRHDAPYFDAYCGKPKTPANPRGMSDYWCWWTRDDREGRGMKMPYAPGQRLYVREAWSVRGVFSDVVEVGYRASENRGHTEYVEQWPVATAVPGKAKPGRPAPEWPEWPKYGPSIHMPRWASRMWLAVTDVRVQRLQECSEVDAQAEGFELAGADPTVPVGLNAYHWYAQLWDMLHTAEGERWQDNPWVVAVSFDVHVGNIDAQVPA